jgi:hypothetical protein
MKQAQVAIVLSIVLFGSQFKEVILDPVPAGQPPSSGSGSGMSMLDQVSMQFAMMLMPYADTYNLNMTVCGEVIGYDLIYFGATNNSAVLASGNDQAITADMLTVFTGLGLSISSPDPSVRALMAFLTLASSPNANMPNNVDPMLVGEFSNCSMALQSALSSAGGLGYVAMMG